MKNNSLPLFLFYEEPDPDRWLPYDRFPRKLIRRIVRGKGQPGGVMRWFLNLKAGLEQLNITCRVNDYHGLARNPGSLACVIGKPHVIDKIPRGHPILYGPGVSAHPMVNHFWNRPDIKRVLLSCSWLKNMYDRDLPAPIETRIWPAGIETDIWQPPHRFPEQGPVLIYDKIRWEREKYTSLLLNPIRNHLTSNKIAYQEIRYGSYKEETFRKSLQNIRAMIFLCEHETQGFAYLQTLSCDVPIFAWDRGGEWKDPYYFPDKVRFEPVTSVPYFDERCGTRFRDFASFQTHWAKFWKDVQNQVFQPRSYVTENFELRGRAQSYLDLATEVRSQ